MIDPADLSREFKIQPEHSFRAGDPRPTRGSIVPVSMSLSATRFLHLHAELLRRIRSEGGEISLLVALSIGELSGFSLVPDVSRVFGEFGITIEFELTDA